MTKLELQRLMFLFFILAITAMTAASAALSNEWATMYLVIVAGVAMMVGVVRMTRPVNWDAARINRLIRRRFGVEVDINDNGFQGEAMDLAPGVAGWLNSEPNVSNESLLDGHPTSQQLLVVRDHNGQLRTVGFNKTPAELTIPEPLDPSLVDSSV